MTLALTVVVEWFVWMSWDRKQSRPVLEKLLRSHAVVRWSKSRRMVGPIRTSDSVNGSIVFEGLEVIEKQVSMLERVG